MFVAITNLGSLLCRDCHRSKGWWSSRRSSNLMAPAKTGGIFRKVWILHLRWWEGSRASISWSWWRKKIRAMTTPKVTSPMKPQQVPKTEYVLKTVASKASSNFPQSMTPPAASIHSWPTLSIWTLQQQSTSAPGSPPAEEEWQLQTTHFSMSRKYRARRA